MLTNSVYVPIIKGKANDLKALSNLTVKAKTLIKPLVEILPVKPQVSVDEHIETFAHNIVKYAQFEELFVDFYGLLPGVKTEAGLDATIAGFRMLRKLGRCVTPTYGLDRDDAVWSLLSNEIKEAGKGFCFRIDIDDLDYRAEETWQEVIERSADLELAPQEIDIMIDLRDVGQLSVSDLKDLVIDFLASNSQSSQYRSIIIAGSSALKTISSVPKDGVLDVTRIELRLWLELQADIGNSIELTFGDYGVVHPDFSDVGPNKNANAKIRYTFGGKIIIFRGHKLYDPSDFGQYHVLAEKVRNSDKYQGRSYSFGDAFVDDCADYNKGPGNLGNWVLADMNHHVEYTAKQLQHLVEEVNENLSEEQIEKLLAFA